MRPIISRKQPPIAVDIDALMQDTYRLVIGLRQKTAVHDSQVLRKICMDQVEAARGVLERTGLAPRSVDYITHAQCALLDETVLTSVHGQIHADWAREPLQARFFNRHQAGRFLYDDMREVLCETAADKYVLTVFQRVLMLGFQGRYQDLADPEREQIVAALNARVAPLAVNQGVVTRTMAGKLIDSLPWRQSPSVHALLVALLLASAWWAMDHWLGGVVASFLRGQA
jgi:type VI secretion system protein ImpK